MVMDESAGIISLRARDVICHYMIVLSDNNSKIAESLISLGDGVAADAAS
jgi:hypothetical protein